MSSKLIAEIYAIFLPLEGQIQARELTGMLVKHIIDDLQIDDLPVTAEAIETGLQRQLDILKGKSSEDAA